MKNQRLRTITGLLTLALFIITTSSSGSVASDVVYNTSCPTATIVSNSNLDCVYGNTFFIVNGTAGARLTYTLTGLTGDQSLLLNGTNQTITVPTGTSSATLELLTVGNNSCIIILESQTSTAVLLLGPPTFTLTRFAKTICAGGTASFTVNGTPRATLHYTWADGSGQQALLLDGTNQTVRHTAGSTDLGLILDGPTLGGCSGNNHMVLVATVLPLPTATIVSNSNLVCVGGEATFTVSGTAGAILTYTLTGCTGPECTGSQTLPLDGTNQTITAKNASSDVILSLLSVTDGNCIAPLLTQTSTVSLFQGVLGYRVVSFTNTVCAGETPGLIVNGTAGATLYYNFDGTRMPFLLDGNDQSIPLPNAVPPYFRIILDGPELGGCSGSNYMVFDANVLPRPTATIVSNSTLACYGGNASFTVSGTAGTTLTYTLTGQAGNQTLPLDGTNQTITAPNATADVTLTLVSVGDALCTTSLSQTSTVSVQAPSFTLVSFTNTVCLGGTVSFTVKGTPGATLYYTWPDGLGPQPLLLDGTNQTVTFPRLIPPGYQFVGLVLDGPTLGNCSGNNHMVLTTTVFQQPAPTAAASVIAPSCQGGNNGSITVSASGSPGPFSYSRDGGITYGASSNFTNLSAGTYSIRVKAGGVCESINQSVTVADPASLITSITGNTSIVRGHGDPSSECTTLTATATGGTGTKTYNWLVPIRTINGGIKVCPGSTTTYTVRTTDANGCTADQDITVMVNDVRCGNNNSGVKMCYQGKEVCVASYLVPTYQRYGGTLGSCNGTTIRVSYEPAQPSERPLQLSLNAYPNPVHDALTLEVLVPTAGAVTFEVLDVTGRAQQSRTEQLAEGLNEVEFRLGSLPTGIYLIRGVDILNQQSVVKVSKE